MVKARQNNQCDASISYHHTRIHGVPFSEQQQQLCTCCPCLRTLRVVVAGEGGRGCPLHRAARMQGARDQRPARGSLSGSGDAGQSQCGEAFARLAAAAGCKLVDSGTGAHRSNSMTC